jgi:hypothetical protein
MSTQQPDEPAPDGPATTAPTQTMAPTEPAELAEPTEPAEPTGTTGEDWDERFVSLLGPKSDYRVADDDDDDPVLLDRNGGPVDTWRENYPYDERMSREEYDRSKRLLQIELLKLQRWIRDTGRRLVILFEGRDAAGKGGTIKRFM